MILWRLAVVVLLTLLTAAVVGAILSLVPMTGTVVPMLAGGAIGIGVPAVTVNWWSPLR